MAKVKVPLYGNLQKAAFVENNATVGATIGTNLFMADGSVATKNSLLAYLGLSSSAGSGGVTAHRLLEGLAIGDDHPQYTRKDTLTTQGDLYVRNATTVTRLGVGTNKQLVRSNGTTPGYATISPTITLSTDLSGNVTLTDLDNGTLAATIVNNAVTDAKLRDSAAVSVIGRSANTSGDPADIAAGANDQLLRRVSNALSFGQLTVGMFPDDVVTYAKIQNVSATSRFLGRITTGAGDIEELTGTQATTLLDTFTSLLKGLVPASGGGTANFLRADGSFAAPAGGVTGLANPTASVGLTAVNGSATTAMRSDAAPPLDQTIAPTWTNTHTFNNTPVVPNDSWTYAKIQNVSATSRVLGRITTGAGDIEELTGANLATIIGTSLGANPTASVGLAAVNGTAGTYLRSDGAPALSQAIVPTWTGAHTFAPASGNTTITGPAAGESILVMAPPGAGADNGKIRFRSTTDGRFQMAVQNDTLTVGTTFIQVNRTGTTVDSLVFSATQTQIPSGTVSVPGLAFSANTDTGIYRFAANTLGLVGGGVGGMQISDTTVTSSLPFVFASTLRPSADFGSDLGSATKRIATVFALDVELSNGTAGNPAYTFLSDLDTGFYRANTNVLVASAGGTAIFAWTSTFAAMQSTLPFYLSDGAAATPSVAFDNDRDTGFFSGTSNKIGIALGGAQAMQFNGVSTTGAQTATFIATNKPGSGTAGPIAWLPVLTAGGTQGYIPIFGA